MSKISKNILEGSIYYVKCEYAFEIFEFPMQFPQRKLA